MNSIKILVDQLNTKDSNKVELIQKINSKLSNKIQRHPEFPMWDIKPILHKVNNEYCIAYKVLPNPHRFYYILVVPQHSKYTAHICKTFDLSEKDKQNLKLHGDFIEVAESLKKYLVNGKSQPLHDVSQIDTKSIIERAIKHPGKSYIPQEYK